MIKFAIYTICWNEELILPFFLSHYKKRFPDAEINVYDNMSTDKSPQIIKDAGCNLIQYDTNNKLNDLEYLKIKNHAWRQSDADWILVCDVDEFIDIDSYQVKAEADKGFNLIQAACYDMINLSDDPNDTNISNIKYGFRHRHWKLPSDYDKVMLWNRNQIQLITYNSGAHACCPYPKEGYAPKIAEKKYPMYHYKYIGENYYVNRIKQYGHRLSEENKKKGWAMGYLEDPEIHRKNFQSIKYRNDLFKILDKNVKDDVVLKNQQKVIDLNGLLRDANKNLSNWIVSCLKNESIDDPSKEFLILDNASRCNQYVETFGYKNVISTFEDMVCDDDGRTFFVVSDIISLLSYRRNKWGEIMAESPRYITDPRQIISSWKKMIKMPIDKIINYNQWLENSEYRKQLSKFLGIKESSVFSPTKYNFQKKLDDNLKSIILSDEELIKINDSFFGVNTKCVLSQE